MVTVVSVTLVQNTTNSTTN